MNNIFNFQSIVIVILLIALATLVHTNNHILEQNIQLTNQVSSLSTKLSNVKVSTNKIEQRMAKLEKQLEPKFHDLLAWNKS